LLAEEAQNEKDAYRKQNQTAEFELSSHRYLYYRQNGQTMPFPRLT